MFAKQNVFQIKQKLVQKEQKMFVDENCVQSDNIFLVKIVQMQVFLTFFPLIQHYRNIWTTVCSEHHTTFYEPFHSMKSRNSYFLFCFSITMQYTVFKIYFNSFRFLFFLEWCDATRTIRFSDCVLLLFVGKIQKTSKPVFWIQCMTVVSSVATNICLPTDIKQDKKNTY